MSEYALTLWSTGMGWRDVLVVNAGDIREAMDLAEQVTGCRVSHGRGGVQSQFHPGQTIDAESGEVTQHHTRQAKPEVALGPAEVVRAIAAVLNEAKQRPNKVPSPRA